MRLLALIGFVVLTASFLQAEEPAKMESVWQKIFRKQAAAYRFTFEGDEQKKVDVTRDPILFWSQPVRGGEDGGVYLWTSSGRPVAIGTFFIWPPAEGGNAITHELHTLTDEAFIADWNGRCWQPPKGSISYTTFAADDPPADTAERRLLQMKKLA